MKKFAIYSILALAGMTLASCNDDYTDWAEPENPVAPGETTISFAPASVTADLRGMTADSVVAFTPNLTVNADDYTAYYDIVIYNTDKTESKTLRADGQGRVSRKQLQDIIIGFYGNSEQARQAIMDIEAHTLVGGSMCLNKADGVGITVTPQKQELPPLWFVLGNCIGRGTFVNHATMGLYTSTVATYVNPFNYEEVILPAYLCTNAQFKIILKPGDKEHFIGGETYSDNYAVADSGYYNIIANTVDMSLRVEPIAGEVVKYAGMSLSNGANLAVITTSARGENHDWLGDLNVDTDTDIRFVAADGTTWGGPDFPAGRSHIGGEAVPVKAGNYKVVFNDINGSYRFIQK